MVGAISCRKSASASSARQLRQASHLVIAGHAAHPVDGDGHPHPGHARCRSRWPRAAPGAELAGHHAVLDCEWRTSLADGADTGVLTAGVLVEQDEAEANRLIVVPAHVLQEPDVGRAGQGEPDDRLVMA